MRAETELTVLRTPTAGSQISYTLSPQEKFQVGPRDNGYRRIRVYRDGRWRAGYVSVDALENMGGAASFGEWGLGAGVLYSVLTQAQRSFKTQDEVEYATSDYKSSSSFPLLVGQMGRNSFWRYSFSLRKTDFLGSATSSVSGSAQKRIALRHTMIGVALQRGWTLTWARWFVYGAGVEIARALKTELTFDGAEIPTTGVNNPLYVMPHALLGVQMPIGRRFLLSIESRLNLVPNQSPLVYGFDVSGSLLYWSF